MNAEAAADEINHPLDDDDEAQFMLGPPVPGRVRGEWSREARERLRKEVRPTRAGSRVAAIIGLLGVLGAFAFVFGEMRPDLLFGPGVDVGGDNGGHIAAPFYLIHYLLPHGQLTGWDPWWFDGFPLYVFYFPLPAVLVALTSVFTSYTVAFKLVTALGTFTLPFCGYAFGRLAAFRRPVPVLMAIAMLPILFNTSYTIDGGNIASTMAGEFSFSLAFSTGLLFLGVVAYALRTGRLRWLAAVLFAITCLCHVVPAIAFAAAAGVMCLATLRPRTIPRALVVLAPIGIVGALLAAWWLLPFAVDLQYSSSMNYQPVGGPHWFSENFLPLDYLFVLIPAAIGAVWSMLARNRIAFALCISGGLSVVAFHWLPSGLVYNARWLPFWFLFAALVAAYGLGELFRLAGRYSSPSLLASLAVVLLLPGSIVGSVFAGGMEGNGFLGHVAPSNHTQVSGWITWNYSGLQAKSGWPVFQGIVKMLDAAGRRYGCGRLQYEYLSETTDPFGSTEEMMSIPMWTNGCMETTDGIYFESSTTTPFHFLDVSEVSQDGEAPDPVAGLDYPGFNLYDGIRHLQLMGVRYFLAMSPPVEAVAATDPDLVEVAAAPSFPGPYNNQPVKDPHVVLYLIKNSPLVEPLTHLPEVEPSTKGQWLDVNLKWYEEPQYWPTMLARSGPAAWPRAKTGTLVPPSQGLPAGQTKVRDVRTGAESISFTVSRLGTPVLVKIPYFPNWEASGATGPYEVSPNLMVVVPTSHHVTLVYGTTKADWAGKAASVLGLAGVVALGVARPANPVISDGLGGATAPITALPPIAAVEPDTRDDEPDENEDEPDETDDEPGPDVEPDETNDEPGAHSGSSGDAAPEHEEVAPLDSGEHVAASPDLMPGGQGLDLSVVLPAHNEEELIESTTSTLLAALRASGRSFELLVVENGSSDSTAIRARALADGQDEVRLIRLATADYGEALRAGFLAARGRVVVNFDVDYFDVSFLEQAVSLVSAGEAGIVLASKRAHGSKDRRPITRRLLTAVFTQLMRATLGLLVTDAHGMKALDRSAVLSDVANSKLTGSLFDVELVTRASRRGLVIAEVPVEVREIRPPRTPVVSRTIESLAGLVKLRWIMGPPRSL
jgi:hypothetical protein